MDNKIKLFEMMGKVNEDFKSFYDKNKVKEYEMVPRLSKVFKTIIENIESWVKEKFNMSILIKIDHSGFVTDFKGYDFDTDEEIFSLKNQHIEKYVHKIIADLPQPVIEELFDEGLFGNYLQYKLLNNDTFVADFINNREIENTEKAA